MTETPYISAREAAAILSLTKRRVNQLVVDGELRSVVIGNTNAIERKSLVKYFNKTRANNHKGGRPRREAK